LKWMSSSRPTSPMLCCMKDVNIMQHIITHRLYTYLVSRFGVIPVNHHHQHVPQT
jgi:hypothetical protein